MKFGVVTIGRNEGERLKACLASLSKATHIVYVDSGSSDGSIQYALGVGAEVVKLDTNLPFTAARARNAGLKQLRSTYPDIEFVQFIDGDCELVSGWPALAIDFLLRSPDVAAVTGRRRERFPDRSIYNWLCDQEWDLPPGKTLSFGGDVMVRACAIEQVAGYREDMIAGEEPELCVRLRQVGWQVWRLAAEMTLHDAALVHLSQWWKRSLRAGYSYGLGSSIHGRAPEFHKVRETLRALFWGACLPVMVIGGIIAFGPASTALLLIYPTQILRQSLKRPDSFRNATKIAFFQTLARFPEAVGELLFLRDFWLGRHRGLIEYK